MRGRRIYDAVASRVDPIDLELYAPFVKHDAVRYYERSKLFFDTLTCDDHVLVAAAPRDAGAPDWTEAPDAPPDDYLDRDPNPLVAAPVCPRFPLVTEEDLDDSGDDDDGAEPALEPPFSADGPFFDPRKFFKKRKVGRKLRELEKQEAELAAARGADARGEGG